MRRGEGDTERWLRRAKKNNILDEQRCNITSFIIAVCIY